MTASSPADAGRVRRLAGRGAVLLVVALFLALLAYGLLTSAPDASIDESLARAQAPAPAKLDLPVFQRGDLGPRLSGALAPALADGRIDVRELRGVPVVLNYWASWCVPCRAEAPLLERTWRAESKKGILLLGVNMQDLTGDARGFMREFGVSYLNVRDPTDGTARRWGVTGIPETFFISGRGRVVGHVIGVVSPGQMRSGLAAARLGRPYRPEQGGAQRSTR